jgi:hypothetical protein
VCRAAHEEFVCTFVDELADWDNLEVSSTVLQRAKKEENILRTIKIRKTN